MKFSQKNIKFKKGFSGFNLQIGQIKLKYNLLQKIISYICLDKKIDSIVKEDIKESIKDFSVLQIQEEQIKLIRTQLTLNKLMEKLVIEKISI